MTLRQNLRWWDRLLRFLFGLVLLAWAIAGGPWWCYFGPLVLASGAWGYCPIYAFLNFRAENR